MSPDLAAGQALFQSNPGRASGPYPDALKPTLSLAAGREAFSQIASWKGYRQTPLVSLDLLADELGVAQLLYKQEAGRFGLGSFKALGGAYAVFRLLADQILTDTGDAPLAADLIAGRHAERVRDITVTCATDGNHGRSVAWGASLFGCQSVIFVHETVSQARADAIAGFGAKVVRTLGNYDDSVREADRTAKENGWAVISDTSYPGYVDIPRNVMQGYSVMAEEIIREMGDSRPTHVFLQGGVGGLAAAVTAHLWESYGTAPIVVVVEPLTAACLYESNRAGRPVAVIGDLDTIMAGLACGEPSLIAWPVLAAGASAFMAIPDEAVRSAMRTLASGTAGARLAGGESGVAGLAGLIELAGNAEWRDAIGLDANSSVLVIGSEGDTDPALYREIVGLTAAEVEVSA